MRKKGRRIVAGILGLVAGTLFLAVTAVLLVMVFGSSVGPEYQDAAPGPHPLGVVWAVLQVAGNVLFFITGGLCFAHKGKTAALIGGVVCLACGVLISITLASAGVGVFHYIGALCFALIVWLQRTPKEVASQA